MKDSTQICWISILILIIKIKDKDELITQADHYDYIQFGKEVLFSKAYRMTGILEMRNTEEEIT